MNIIIWDNKPSRALGIESNLCLALQKHNLHAHITIQSEPPLIARTGIGERLPVLEIAGNFWSLMPGQCFSVEDCERLLQLLAQNTASALGSV